MLQAAATPNNDNNLKAVTVSQPPTSPNAISQELVADGTSVEVPLTPRSVASLKWIRNSIYSASPTVSIAGSAALAKVASVGRALASAPSTEPAKDISSSSVSGAEEAEAEVTPAWSQYMFGRRAMQSFEKRRFTPVLDHEAIPNGQRGSPCAPCTPSSETSSDEEVDENDPQEIVYRRVTEQTLRRQFATSGGKCTPHQVRVFTTRRNLTCFWSEQMSPALPLLCNLLLSAAPCYLADCRTLQAPAFGSRLRRCKPCKVSQGRQPYRRANRSHRGRRFCDTVPGA